MRCETEGKPENGIAIGYVSGVANQQQYCEIYELSDIQNVRNFFNTLDLYYKKNIFLKD